MEPANALFSTPKFQSMAAECCAKPSINWPIRPLFSLFSSQLFDLIQTTRHLCPNQVSVSWTFLEPCDTEFTKKKKILIETPTGRPSIDFLAASIFTVSKQMATENFKKKKLKAKRERLLRKTWILNSFNPKWITFDSECKVRTAGPNSKYFFKLSAPATFHHFV